MTAGVDANLDGDFLDPEDTQPEDALGFAFKPGNGQLDALARRSAANLLRLERVPDARGDTRGGRRPRISTVSYEPIYNQVRSSTDPRAFDPDYVPQNGGLNSLARYTTTRFFDYQQGPAAPTLTALAAEIGESEAETAQLLADAGVADTDANMASMAVL